MSIETSLSEWMLKQPDYVVAVDKNEKLYTDALVLRASHWAHTLTELKGNRWAVYHENAFEYLSILFALWQLGKTACVPGDNCLGTIERLQPIVDGFIGQFDTDVVQIRHGDNKAAIEWKKINLDYDALEIYTSGSTGEPKPIAKSLSQLEKEIVSLETLWGDDTEAVIATVSHQHFYGMIFRLFWPVSTHVTFETYLCSCSEDVFHSLVRHMPYRLVTSPTHLSRINPELDWGNYQSKCRRVISSAAPLSREKSLKTAALLGCDIFEIYGSSETGAVAWRCQQLTDDDALWETLPGVEGTYGEQQTLKIRSDYQRGGEPFELSDRVDFCKGGKFALLGRLDRIVKVEGKRVALNSLEQALSHCLYVKDSKVLVLEKRRVEVAAVIRLSDSGWRYLREYGRKRLIKEYKTDLAYQFEPVAIPRKWRFVGQYPCDQQGKIPHQKLKTMFDKKPENWPVITDQTLTSNEVMLTCYAQEELIYFNGHFEGNPILPGVVQVHWAQEMARHFLGVDLEFTKLEVIKFQQVITPYREINICLKFDPDKRKVYFRYESEKGVHSSGRICFK